MPTYEAPYVHQVSVVDNTQSMVTAILLVSAQQAATPGGGSTPPTTGQLWPRGNV